MASRATNRQVRQRKLSTKTNLKIHREGEIELLPVDDDASRNIPKIETGVEKAEEIEHHLQAIIQQPQQGAAELYIPTRDTTASALDYDQYYPNSFVQPATYIRFSSTVEDCISGVPYCMNEDDELFLKAFNQKKSGKARCSEESLEDVLNFFEETAATKQPYSSMGNTPVLTFDEMQASLDDDDAESPSPDARRFVKDIYEHWKTQRIKRDNQPLMPTLKFERNIEADESDPYVCFRRREHRQVRKTRGRDAQVTEKIKRLRNELEQARQLIHHVKTRETIRQHQMDMDRRVFENRVKVRDTKRQLGIKGDDEDLINQKPSPKPKPTLLNGPHRLPPGAQFPGNKSLLRSDSLTLRSSDAELPQLDEIRHNEASKRKSFVDENKAKHHDDSDVDPLGQGLRGWKGVDMVAASTVQAGASLPTPPASIASPPADEEVDGDKAGPPSKNTRSHQVVRFASPPLDGLVSPQPIRPVFRKRVGRGGRVMIDRRAPKRSYSQSFPEPSSLFDAHPSLATRPYNFRQHKQPRSSDAADSDEDMGSPFGAAMNNFSRMLDRFQYDVDDDDEEDEDHAPRMYLADPAGNMAIAHRMMWARNSAQEAANQQHMAQQAKMARMSIGSAQQQAMQQQQQQAQAARAAAAAAAAAAATASG